MKEITIKSLAKAINVSENLAGKYLRGVVRPSFENMYKLDKENKIPFHAWLDIKSYLQDNNTKQNGTTTRTQGQSNGN